MSGKVAGLAFAAGDDKRSRLPTLTAPSPARRLDITPQAALRLFARLEQAGLVREVTGRDIFRAFALAVQSRGQISE